MEKIETMPVLEFAKALGTKRAVIESAMLNGTLQGIGFVGQGEKGRHRIILLRDLCEKYLKGEMPNQR